MNKVNKWTKNIALSAISYLRMVLVIGSLVAWSEREWLGLLLTVVGFGITTTFINKVIDYPSDETIQELSKNLEDFNEAADTIEELSGRLEKFNKEE